MDKRGVGRGIGLGLKRWLASVVVLAGVVLQSLGQAPLLEVAEVTPTQARLRARTTAEGNVNLEGSFDLRQWFAIESKPPAGGVAEFVHPRPNSAAALFYRAVQAVAPRSVGPKLDRNAAAAVLLTPEEGGRMEIALPEGVRYEFQASSNLVEDLTPVRMTVITNFTDFPEHGGFRAAVSLEPDGLDFRGEATLRITFPEALPKADMLAYSFARSGAGFHLIESDPEDRSITLALGHFSGAGVASFPNAAPSRFDTAWDGAKEAIRAAEDRAARRQREINRDRFKNETITEEEANRREKESRLQKYEEIYQNAVQPYEAMAGTDCAIGQAVVLGELERLDRLWARETGLPGEQNPYRQRQAQLAAQVRCACAKALLDRCENDPNASGSALLSAMESLLLDARVATGRTDAQGCDLGSDEQILDRLYAGPCFGKWEGTIVLTRVKTRQGTGTLPAAGLTQTWDDETREVYSGSLAGIKSEESFTVGGKHKTVWQFNTKGPVHFGHRVNQTIVFDSPSSDIVSTERVTASVSDSSAAVGDIHLTLTDGQFDGLGAGGGNSAIGYRLPYTSYSATTYRCKVPFPPNNPCPSPVSNSTRSSFTFFQGYFVGKDDPHATVAVTPRRVSLTWRERVEFPNDYGPPDVREESIVMNLVRVPK